MTPGRLREIYKESTRLKYESREARALIHEVFDALPELADRLERLERDRMYDLRDQIENHER